MYAYVLGIHNGTLSSICHADTTEEALEEATEHIKNNSFEYSRYALLQGGWNIEELTYTPPTLKGSLKRTGKYGLKL